MLHLKWRTVSRISHQSNDKEFASALWATARQNKLNVMYADRGGGGGGSLQFDKRLRW